MVETTDVPVEPDQDSIKMFVGQIPRHWNEPDCWKLFEKYGPIYSLNILRDKHTQTSKGCCFVLYYHRKDAIAAQCALHNIETIDGMHHAIQMKPADTENRNERKLFIGQLSKKQNEEEVRTLFCKFGHIEDCSVLRDTESRSRGCAFVTFSTRLNAVNACKEMHHSQTMEGCTAPLVVKFVDSQKERDVKGKGGSNPASVSPSLPSVATNPVLQQLGVGGIPMQTLTALAALLQGQQQQPNMLGLLGGVLSALGKLSEKGGSASISGTHVVPTTTAAVTNTVSSTTNVQPQLALQPHGQSLEALAQIQQLHLVQQQLQQQQILALLGQQQQHAQHQAQEQKAHQQANSMSGMAGYGYQGAALMQSPAVSTNVTSYAAQHHISSYQKSSGVKLDNSPPTPTMQSIHMGQANVAVDPRQQALQQYSFPDMNTMNPALGVAGGAGMETRDMKEPDRSNLFIYHLPQDFNNSDLMSIFGSFGNVTSAKVFVDKITNLSNCFGFVSFDSALSAQNAIAAMNGFRIGSQPLGIVSEAVHLLKIALQNAFPVLEDGISKQLDDIAMLPGPTRPFLNFMWLDNDIISFVLKHRTPSDVRCLIRMNTRIDRAVCEKYVHYGRCNELSLVLIDLYKPRYSLRIQSVATNLEEMDVNITIMQANLKYRLMKYIKWCPIVCLHLFGIDVEETLARCITRSISQSTMVIFTCCKWQNDAIKFLPHLFSISKKLTFEKCEFGSEFNIFQILKRGGREIIFDSFLPNVEVSDAYSFDGKSVYAFKLLYVPITNFSQLALSRCMDHAFYVLLKSLPILSSILESAALCVSKVEITLFECYIDWEGIINYLANCHVASERMKIIFKSCVPQAIPTTCALQSKRRFVPGLKHNTMMFEGAAEFAESTDFSYLDLDRA